MTTPRWNTRDTGSDLYLIECGNVVVGSIARLLPADIWRVEVLWSGAGGDITAEFNSYGKALCFIQGVELAWLANLRGAVPAQPARVTANDYAYDGWIVSQFNKLRGATRYVVEDDKGRLFIHNAKQLGLEPDTSDIPEANEDWFKAAKLKVPKE